MILSHRHRLSRRALLRGAALGGSGLLGAYLLGCGDGKGKPAATATRLAGSATPTSGTLSWRRVNAIGSGANSDEFPAPRRDHSAVWDGSHLYVFGGRSGDRTLGDLWAFGTWAQESQWNNKLQANEGPPARFGHNAVWDAQRGRMIIFGGQNGSTFYNDVWDFEPATGRWTSNIRSGIQAAPQPRYGAGAAYDEAGHLVITHGFTTEGRFDDTWQRDLALTSWQDVSPQGTRPIERCLMRAVWDSTAKRLLMFGGQTTSTPFLGDLWALSSAGWTELKAEPRPSPRNFYAMAFADQAGQAFLVGGRTDQGPANDLWLFDSASDSWNQPSVAGEPPSARYGHDAAWLGGGLSLFVFGGNDGSADLNDLWQLNTAIF